MASWVVLNLEEFFEEEDATDNRRRDRMYSYIYGMPSSSQEDNRRLSKRRPLKFISDLDTNTILVQGADPEQLKTIAELIKLYDVPEPVSSQKARVTKLFTIKYSKATIVAGVIKDAYRDLLSSNDRALQDANRNKQQQPQRGGGGMTIISPFGFGDEQSPADTRTSARFEGKLSIGVDDVSNTLLVSTEGDSLMQMVSGMIEAIDEAAKPVSEVPHPDAQSRYGRRSVEQDVEEGPRGEWDGSATVGARGTTAATGPGTSKRHAGPTGSLRVRSAQADEIVEPTVDLLESWE